VENRLKNGFRMIFNSTSEEVKKSSLFHFIQIVRNSPDWEVDIYVDMFIMPSDIKYAPAKEQELLKDLYLSRQDSIHSSESASQYSFLAEFLSSGDASKWLDSFIRALSSSKMNQKEHDSIRNSLLGVQHLLQENCFKLQIDRLQTWIDHFVKLSRSELVENLNQLKNDLSSSRELPF